MSGSAPGDSAHPRVGWRLSWLWLWCIPAACMAFCRPGAERLTVSFLSVHLVCRL